MDDFPPLDTSDIQSIVSVMGGLSGLGDHTVKINKIEFTIYNEHKVTASRSGKWQPIKVRRIVRVGS